MKKREPCKRVVIGFSFLHCIFLPPLSHCWWECKLVQPLWRTAWRFLKKLELELPYDPAIPLLGIHTEETRIERDTCTPMFITALFLISRTWNQPRCPSADEWIRKLWYIYTMEYSSAIKKNTFESVLMRWMKLDPIIQSELSQKEKHQYSILMHIMEKVMAPHSSTLAWQIPWTEEPGRLQSMGLRRVGHG